MRQIKEKISFAIDAIESTGIQDENGAIDNRVKGYIEIFSASLINNGILPAIVFFESNSLSHEQNEIEEYRKKILNVILRVLEMNLTPDFENLLEWYQKEKKNKEKRYMIKKRIIDATIIVKLALRTFQFEQK